VVADSRRRDALKQRHRLLAYPWRRIPLRLARASGQTGAHPLANEKSEQEHGVSLVSGELRELIVPRAWRGERAEPRRFQRSRDALARADWGTSTALLSGCRNRSMGNIKVDIFTISNVNGVNGFDSGNLKDH
jgi:hypothetical protein